MNASKQRCHDGYVAVNGMVGPERQVDEECRKVGIKAEIQWNHGDHRQDPSVLPNGLP